MNDVEVKWIEEPKLKKAILIEVENTRLLVGVTPGHIQTLHVLGTQNAQPAAFDTTLQQLQQKNEQKNA